MQIDSHEPGTPSWVDLGSPDLAAAAAFDTMRERADDLAPGGDPAQRSRHQAVFRAGSRGQWPRPSSAGCSAGIWSSRARRPVATGWPFCGTGR